MAVARARSELQTEPEARATRARALELELLELELSYFEIELYTLHLHANAITINIVRIPGVAWGCCIWPLVPFLKLKRFVAIYFFPISAPPGDLVDINKKIKGSEPDLGHRCMI